jgi:hypothetical protein
MPGIGVSSSPPGYAGVLTLKKTCELNGLTT